MQGLTYEQRKQIVFNFLYAKEGGLLRRYRLPEHLSDDALRDEVNLLVEDINGLIPSGYTEADMRLLTPEINAEIRRRHGAQGWPPAKVFIAATEDAVAAAAKKKADAEPKREFTLDPVEMASHRMHEGEPVSESYLWGVSAIELIAQGLIDEETMTAYRSGAFVSRREQAGEDAAIRWEQDAKARHQSAKEAYLARKHGGEGMTPEAMSRIQRDLEGVARRMDERSAEMRRWA